MDEKELFDREFKVRFTKTMWRDLIDKAVEARNDVSTLVRRGVDRELQAIGNGEPLTLPLHHGAPCGEWRSTDEQVTDFELNPQLVQVWGAQPKDGLIATEGCSMLGVGIPEKAILLMRPFVVGTPRSGDICAVIALLDDGSYVGTVKQWEWSGSNVVLKDGEGKKIGLPDDAIRIEAISKWTGHLLTY